MMKTFNKVVTKWNVFLISGIFFLFQLFTVLYTYIANNYCSAHYPCSGLVVQFAGWIIFIAGIAILNVPIFIFSLITYRLKDAVFRTWVWFTIVWIVLFILVLSGVDGQEHGGAFGIYFSPRDMVALYNPFLYTAASTVIVSLTSFIVYLRKK